MQMLPALPDLWGLRPGFIVDDRMNARAAGPQLPGFIA